METVGFAIDAEIIVINQGRFIHWKTVRTVRLVFRETSLDQKIKDMNVARNGEYFTA